MAQRPVSPTIIFVAIAAVAMAASIGGCGGTDDSADTEPTATERPAEIGLPLVVNSLGEDQYLARANAICRKSWARMRKSFRRIQREEGSRLGKGELFDLASERVFLPGMQFWFDDITYLGSPKGHKERLEKTLYALQIGVFAAEGEFISSPAELSAIFASFSMLAGFNGLDDCLVEEQSPARST